ncbi:MAG TPA: LysR family transcriptional regulator [Burkholderiaceae bacterium]|nr:LysR family transcriptional regulator [Burkholderiaceae bacterium]
MNEINLAHLDLNLLVTFEVLMTEGSVTRAAERLGRTQSAISHSLARLRDQLGDPLLIKVGSAMVPSPFALQLVEDVRPILRSIQRIAALPQHFEPARSERTFRVAVSDFTPSVLPEVMARTRREAPHVAVEWTTPGPATPLAIADGHVDVALLASATAMPDGVERQDAGELKVWTYLRKDHPALASWGLDEWRRWPHIQVVLGDRQRTTLDTAIAEADVKRTIGARVPHFSCVPDLLVRTDMLATLPLLISDEVLEQTNLCAAEPPLPIAPVPLSYFWSFRLTNDPGARWIRSVVMATFADLQRRVRPKPTSRR